MSGVEVSWPGASKLMANPVFKMTSQRTLNSNCCLKIGTTAVRLKLCWKKIIVLLYAVMFTTVLEPLLDGILHRIPAMENAEIRQMINGPESFTPDMHAILGEAPEVIQHSIALN